jgi:hypothetical protein
MTKFCPSDFAGFSCSFSASARISIAPKDSFIHAEDFDFDITKLTAYLNEVSKNFKLFLKHLQWKYDYDVFFEAKEVEQNRICELCTKLNTYDKMKHYKSVSNYFNNNCAKN